MTHWQPLTIFITGQIEFLEEPRNVTVVERTDAFFACSYRGIRGVPSWRIDNIPFVISTLPPKHSYNGSGLVVSNVDLSLNMTSYACFFTVHIGRGQFKAIQSETGFLIIAGIHCKKSQTKSGCFRCSLVSSCSLVWSSWLFIQYTL